MNITRVSGASQYLKTQIPEVASPDNNLVKEQSPGVSKDTLNQSSQDLSNQAFQVAITDKARDVYRTEQVPMEPRQSQDLKQEMTGAKSSTPGENQGPQRIVDLIA